MTTATNNMMSRLDAGTARQDADDKTYARLTARQARRDANHLMRYQAKADAHRDMALDGLGRYAVLDGDRTIFMTDDLDLADAVAVGTSAILVDNLG